MAKTSETFIDVEGVVSNCGDHKVAGVHCAAEELEAVIVVGVDFDILEERAGTNTTKGEAVDFVGCTNFFTTVANGDELEGTGAVIRVATAVCGKLTDVGRNKTLNLTFVWLVCYTRESLSTKVAIITIDCGTADTTNRCLLYTSDAADE